MITLLLLPALESIINRALKCDPDALAKIATINNAVIKVECTDWHFIFYIIIENEKLQFHQKVSCTADTHIKSTLSNFLKLMVKGADSVALFQHPIEITGNTHNMEVLRDAFKNLDIDWEERLSHYLGDAIAHKIFSHFKKTKASLEKSAETLAAQTSEYIYFEAKHFPTRKQVEKFYVNIATLRDDVERIEARINKL